MNGYYYKKMKRLSSHLNILFYEVFLCIFIILKNGVQLELNFLIQYFILNNRSFTTGHNYQQLLLNEI